MRTKYIVRKSIYLCSHFYLKKIMIYFIIQLDKTLIIILTIFSFIMFITSVIDGENMLGKYKHLFFGLFLIGSLLITFIPSSKDAYEIYKATNQV